MFKLSIKWCYVVLAMITLLGLHLRLQAVYNTEVDTPVRADARDYLLYAMNLKKFNTYSRSVDALNGFLKNPKPDAVRTPGYPLYLSLFIGSTVTSKALLGIELSQVLLSLITLILVYYTFAYLLNPLLALFVTFFTAISPHLITANVFVLSESLFCFLLLLFVYLLSRWRQKSHSILMVAIGLVLSMSSLTRPWLQYFIFIFVPLVAMTSPSKKPKWDASLVFLGFIIPLGFWTMRNFLALGMVGDDTLMITTLYHGIYPGMMYNNNPESLGFPYRFDPRSAEISTSLSSLLMEILRRFRDSPLEYFNWYVFGKPVMLFSWNIYEGMGDVFIYPISSTPYNDQLLFKITHWIMQYLHYWLVGLSGLGCLMAWLPNTDDFMDIEQRFSIRCISALFAYFVLIHCIGAPFSRYSIPMQPLIYGMAIFSLWYLWNLLVGILKTLKHE